VEEIHPTFGVKMRQISLGKISRAPTAYGFRSFHSFTLYYLNTWVVTVSSESLLTQEPKELSRSPHIFPTNFASLGVLKTRSLK
jgi:hypothetical protein